MFIEFLISLSDQKHDPTQVPIDFRLARLLAAAAIVARLETWRVPAPNVTTGSGFVVP